MKAAAAAVGKAAAAVAGVAVVVEAVGRVLEAAADSEAVVRARADRTTNLRRDV